MRASSLAAESWGSPWRITRYQFRWSPFTVRATEASYAIVQALIERGVIGDYREPGLMRFGFAPLYLSHEDVWQAAQHLRQVLAGEEHLAPRFQQRGAVT